MNTNSTTPRPCAGCSRDANGPAMVLLDQLIALPPHEWLARLWTLPRLLPRFGKNIVYRHGNWDGLLSGALRWNGGFFLFQSVLDEENVTDWSLAEDREGIFPERDGRRYYAVYLIGKEHCRQTIRRAVAFRRHVGTGDYRRPGRALKSQDNWGNFYNRVWPKIEDDQPPVVVAWFDRFRTAQD